ncbi:MAG: DUF302 domain-containing protein [Pseudomonadota bacterium]
MRSLLFGALLALAAPLSAWAEGVKLYDYEGSFEDATFDLRTAIEGRGLVIDYVSHVGEMLARTKADVAGSKDLYAEADIFLFCSAVVSRSVMEADPDNIAHCPYGIFVRQAAGGDAVQIGYREMPEGAMQEVEALLASIVREAVGQ